MCASYWISFLSKNGDFISLPYTVQLLLTSTDISILMALFKTGGESYSTPLTSSNPLATKRIFTCSPFLENK